MGWAEIKGEGWSTQLLMEFDSCWKNVNRGGTADLERRRREKRAKRD